MGRQDRLRYRHLRRTLIAVPAAVVFFALVVGLLAVCLESAPVQDRVRRWIVSKVARSAGVELSIGTLRWRILVPTLELTDVVARAGGVRAEVDEVRVELGAARFFERELQFDTVALSGVRVTSVGIPEQRSGQGTGWVRLRVAHLDVRDVEVVGRDLPGRLGIVLSDLDTTWSAVDGPLRGFVRVGAARLDAPGVEPIELSLGARFRRQEQFEIDRLRVRAVGLWLDGAGHISTEGVPVLRAHGELDLAELDRVVRARAGLEGKVALTAAVDGSEAQPVKVRVTADRVEAVDFPVFDLRGSVELGPQGVTGVLEDGRFHGGVVKGRYRLRDLRRPFRQEVALEGRRVALAGLLANLGVPPGELNAVVDVAGGLRWSGKNVPGGLGSARAQLVPGSVGLGVKGSINARLESQGVILFASEDLQIGGSQVAWQGPLTLGKWEPAWAVRAQPAVLDEIGPLVNTWVGSEVVPPTLAGKGDLQISFAGPWKQLRVGLRLEADPLVYPPMRFDRVMVEAEIADGALDVESVLFRVGDGDGRISGKISWMAPETDQIDLSFRGQDIPLERVGNWIDAPVSVDGSGSFAGRLRGSLKSAKGSWALGLSDVVVAETRIGDGSAAVALEQGRFVARDLGFSEGLTGNVWWQVPDGEVGGDLSWEAMPLAPLGHTAVSIVGSIADAEVDFRWPFAEAPVGNVELVGPGLTAVLESDVDKVVSDIEVDGVGTASLLLSRDPSGGLSGGGRVELSGAQELVTRIIPEAQIPLYGRSEARLEIELPSTGAPSLHGVLEALDLELDERPIRLVQPAEFSVTEDGVRLQGLLLRVLEDELFMRWSLGADGELEGNFSGTLDALLARFLLPIWEPSGKVTGIVELLGSVAQPRLEGIAELSQLSFRLPGSRQVVSGVSGTVLLSADEAVLEGLDFRFMNGLGRCSGSLRPRQNTVELGLDGTIDRLTVPLFPGLEPSLHGVWRLQGIGDRLELSGDLEVEHAVLRRNEDLATILVDWFGQPEDPDLGHGLALDLHVEADRALEARTALLRLLGSASLDITGTTVQPGLVGRIDFQEGGEITFLGARYELERGSVTFTDPLAIDPFVDFQLRAWVESYQVMVGLTGTFDRLVPTFASDPPLPEAEIFSLMTLGRREETAHGRAVGMGLASTLLTRELNAELERRARELLPIDQVRLDPFSEEATGNPTARVTMVKQVSPRWTVVVQGNLSTNLEEVVVSRWHLSRGLFLEATRDLDGSYALDIKLRRRY